MAPLSALSLDVAAARVQHVATVQEEPTLGSDLYAVCSCGLARSLPYVYREDAAAWRCPLLEAIEACDVAERDWQIRIHHAALDGIAVVAAVA